MLTKRSECHIVASMSADEHVLHALTAGDRVPGVLRQLRDYFGATDAELARLINMKRTTLRGKLHGQGSFSPGELRALAVVFGVPLDILYLPPADAMRWVLDHPSDERAVRTFGSWRPWSRRSKPALALPA